MHIMARLRGAPQPRSALIAFCLALSLSLSPGCARPEPLHPADASSPASEQELPFRSDSDQTSASDGARTGAQAAVSPDPKLASSLPFRAASHPRILPSGTLLTVQLEDSLVASKVRAGDAFTASVAAPLTIDGDTLIERGTAVIGRIESAQSQADRPGLVPGAGYFRLTLSAITVDGRQLVLQTSSLFTRGTLTEANVSSGGGASYGGPGSGNPGSGNTPNAPSRSVRVQKGRRLTFRLTAPVTIDGPNSTANRQNLGPLPE
jgi:hypothetical protein